MTTNDNYEIITTESGLQNPAAVYIRSLPSPMSQSTQRDALNAIARKLLGIEDIKQRPAGVGRDDAFLFDWSTLRYEHTSAIQTWLLATHAPATARRYIAAVKGALKAAWRMGQIADGDYLRAIDLGSIAGSTATGRMLSPEEVAALLATCAIGGPTIGTRDAAILMIMVLYTARRFEITTIQYSDYTPEYKPGVARLVLHGKGRKDRTEFLSNGEREIMTDWLSIRGSDPGPMFYVILKSDEIVRRKMTPITVYHVIRKRMQRAGIQNATVHDLRRTAISNLLDITDAVTVARMAGHSSTEITMRYDKRGESRMIDALAKLHLPFRREDRLVEAI